MQIEVDGSTDWPPEVLTSVVDEPAVVAAHGILLLDHAYEVALLYGDVQVLGRVEVAVSLEELLGTVSYQEPCAVLVGLRDEARLERIKGRISLASRSER